MVTYKTREAVAELQTLGKAVTGMPGSLQPHERYELPTRYDEFYNRKSETGNRAIPVERVPLGAHGQGARC